MSRPLLRRPFPGLSALTAGVLLGSVLVAAAQTQDLATVAKKEKERRAKIEKPTPVLKEGDAKGDASGTKPGSVTIMSEPAAGSGAAAGSAGGRTSDPVAQKALWQSRAQQAREAISNAEKALADSETVLAEYKSDQRALTAAEARDPMRLQKRDARILELTAQRDAQKQVLADAKKALASLEGEARRSGVPPGWLR